MSVNVAWKGCAPRNFRAGRSNHPITAVVLHLIDGSQSSADHTFLDNNLDYRRSAHYSISKSGRIHQYVREHDTAYHAGRLINPTWPKLERIGGTIVNPNLYTIGIEHEGRAHDEWTSDLYAASAALLREISDRYPDTLGQLSRDNIALHREIRADKSCPGFKFSFDRLWEELEGGASPAPSLDPAGSQNSDITDEPDSVRIEKRVNLRRAHPSTSAPIIRVIPVGSYMNVVGTAKGDSFQDTNVWYRTIEGDYLWSGATDAPLPAR